MFAGLSEAPLTLGQHDRASSSHQRPARTCRPRWRPMARRRCRASSRTPRRWRRCSRGRARPAGGQPAAEFDLQLRIWLHCEALALPRPYQARNRELALGLAIATPTAPTGRLREGDRVRIEVTNARRDGYLWVDYHGRRRRAAPERGAGAAAPDRPERPSSSDATSRQAGSRRRPSARCW